MTILSENGDKLINYDNVCSIYIHTPSEYTRWEIRAMYGAVDERNVLYDTIYSHSEESRVKEEFMSLMRAINDPNINFWSV